MSHNASSEALEQEVQELRKALEQERANKTLPEQAPSTERSGEETFKSLDFLYKTSVELYRSRPIQDIYALIGRHLQEIVGKAVVVINSYDPPANVFEVQTILGLGTYTESIIRLLNKDPVGMQFEMNDADAKKTIQAGRLSKGPTGIYELSFQSIPKGLSRTIEVLLNAGEIYVIGFTSQEELLGSAVIITRRGKNEKYVQDHTRLIETYINQAAIALQRHIVEKALLQSEKKYRFVVDNALSGIFVIQDGHYQYVNARAAHIFHTTREHLLNSALYECVHPDDRELCSKRVNIRKNGGTTDELLEHRIIDGNGDVKWVEVRGISVDWEGKHASMSFVNDITERKEQEEFYRLLLQNSHDIFVIIDENGKETFVSESVAQITGMTVEEVLGTVGFDLIHPDDVTRVKDNFAWLLQHPGKSRRVEYRHRHKNGSWVHLEALGTNLLHHPVINGIVINIRDCTDRKKAENDIQEARKFLESAIEQSPSGILIAAAPDVSIQFANHAAKDILGVESTALTGINFSRDTKAWQTLYSDGSPYPSEDLPLSRAALRGEITQDEEFMIRDSAGSVKWVKANAAPIYGADDRITSGIVVFHDITARKQAEEQRENFKNQLQQAQKMESVGRLAGGVAHDFNNMLSVILGNTELALDQVHSNQPLHLNLTEIQKAAQRSTNVVRQLLAFARKQTIAPRVLDLNETVEEMLKMLRRLIGEDIELIWKPGLDLWTVKVDASQIDQILANLSVNARDAIAGVGRLTIETGKKSFDEAYCAAHPGFMPGDFVMLAVSDTGCGMDAETRKNLFEPFFTTKEVGKGTGLGLATVYGIVKQNSGFINVYSEPGQGTTFRIYLPRHRMLDTPVRAEEPVAVETRGTETILLVEDEATILKMTRMMLEHLGYSVLAALTPGEALDVARKYGNEIHLLITDVVMPEMNGRDLAARLLSFYPDLKWLFMSGYTENAIAHHGILDEGVNFIQKPFSRQELSLQVRKVLDAEDPFAAA